MGRIVKRFVRRIAALNAFMIILVFFLWRRLFSPDLSLPPEAYLPLAGALIIVLIPLNSFLINRLVAEPKRKKQAEGITPHALLSEVEAFALALTEGKEIELITDCHSLLMGVVLHPDKRVFMRIVTGILRNAVATMERGTMTILFSLIQEGGKKYLEISVADAGQGMDAGVSEGLVQEFPFHPAAPELSVSAALLDTLGGKLAIESTPGKGSVVMAAIPLERIL